MSFYTSLSGLKGAQADLATVSNNVANVNSYGFKKSMTLFGDIASGSRTTPGYGTRLKAIEQQFMQGGFEATARELDIAITGNGFLVTRSSLTGGPTLFTRNGHLSLSEDNYLMDAAGGYVQVMPVDNDGNVTSMELEAVSYLQVPELSGTPRATSEMNISLTLPSSASIPVAPFDRLDPNSYNHSVQTTVNDSEGRSIPSTIYYRRTSATTWETRLFVGNTEVSSNPLIPTPPTPLTLTFDAGTGALTAPLTRVNYAPVTPGGSSTPLNIGISYPAATTRQAASAFDLASLTQNGVAVGRLDDISIGDDGMVTATYSNGDTRGLGKVAIANFGNPVGLKQRGDAHWSVTGESGDAVLGEAGSQGFGAIQSGGLERANVDITEELVALISAQRNFQANAKAIETASNMTQSIMNMRT
ncbi:flagellar hook protein FlgE [Allosphingosinicella flava]|uniref:Flagellar hook protein FlgE n=1 Tax=Allosphingosinicella flava TaxID=2771430 RepID=A0A7T2GK37_9SPHN|nr:flagellar hook protein FlgE [Sphingosinicella flava]QPQ55336.1 flagellar hook protein FlgE [Sphingosinicella flava]